MSNLNVERVLSVHHWNDTLFSFKCTRDPGLRFENGQFVMIGLQQPNGRPLMRAYSIASPNYEEHLEFFSIKVPERPADLTVAAPQGRRRDHHQQEAHRHPGAG